MSTATQSPADLEATVRAGIKTLELFSGPDKGHAMILFYVNDTLSLVDRHSDRCAPCLALEALALLREQAERAEAAERERDKALGILSNVRSKTALDVVAENMEAQNRARSATTRALDAEASVRELASVLEYWVRRADRLEAVLPAAAQYIRAQGILHPAYEVGRAALYGQGEA